MQQNNTIRTKDGCKIGVKLYTHDTAHHKVILIGSSVAVTQEYYHDLAVYFQSEGYPVVTFDYRGVGLSAPDHLKGYKADLHQWAVQDLDAVILYTRNNFPGKEIIFIGHGVGGELVGLSPASQYISRLVLINSSLTCKKLWPLKDRVRIRLQKIFIRTLYTVFGYLPGKWAGSLPNLPKGVVHEWLNWCSNSNGLFDQFPDNNYRKLQIPLLAFSFSDDWRSPRRAVQELLNYFSSAQVTWHHLTPANTGMKKTGHLGPFRKHYRDTIWKSLSVWIRKGE